MKQLAWILNSSLLVLFFMSQLFLFMMQRAIPRRISIVPDLVQSVPERAVKSIDITTIYKRDLFGTYEPPVQHIERLAEEQIVPMPLPPKNIIPDVPVEKAPTFFAPLEVVLKGVIFVKDDPASCVGIIQSKKTKEEHNYRVGDLIEDAQILKILSNRIIIIRSNGQQETLYLREEDAIADFKNQNQLVTDVMVELVSDHFYKLDISEFCKRIHNLGQLISVLDITTVYKQGKSFGCRIGNIEKKSLGDALGFVVDDIVVKVDDYFVDELDSRLRLYEHILQKRPGDRVEVILYRGAEVITLTYGLVDKISESITFTPHQTQQKVLQDLSRHEAKIQAEIEKSVAIQMVSQEQLDAIDDQVSESLVAANFVAPAKPLNPLLPERQNEAVDGHEKILQEEYAKLSPMVKNMRSRDKNMMKQINKNIISNGI